MQFKTHADIDPDTESYICTVAGVTNIYELDIDTINEYLEGLNNFYNTKKEVAYCLTMTRLILK